MASEGSDPLKFELLEDSRHTCALAQTQGGLRKNTSTAILSFHQSMDLYTGTSSPQMLLYMGFSNRGSNSPIQQLHGWKLYPRNTS